MEAKDGALQVQTADGTAPLTGGGASFLLLKAGGGDAMVTYGDMFAYTLVLIGVVGLCIQIVQFRNKKK